MTTVALVHGSNLGAWCWDFLIPELRARGHDGVAVDLPIEDPSAGLSRYADVVLSAIADRQDVVVLGHSLGGIVVPIVAARRPVRRMIFLSAAVPEPGRSLAEQQVSQRMSTAAIPGGARPTWTTASLRAWAASPEGVARSLHDVDPERRRFAIARLRVQSSKPLLEPSPLTVWPSVPSTYIMCADDRAIERDYMLSAARRLGVDPILIPGSHSPFLARPAELADVLVPLLGPDGVSASSHQRLEQALDGTA